MIAFLKGRPVFSGVDYVVLDVSGVGYKVFVPTPVIGKVADSKEDVIIHTYMHVREDIMQLFGFLQEGDREIFELLIQVSGIGPRVALGVMSAMPASSFVSAVVQEQTQVLTQIPGVGKKTAQRIIIELKDKLGKLGNVNGQEMPLASESTPDGAGDALQALTALGYNPAEIRKVLAKVVGAGAANSPEEMVRLALKELGRY